MYLFSWLNQDMIKSLNIIKVPVDIHIYIVLQSQLLPKNNNYLELPTDLRC
ncbi:hypothetical protein DPMN_103192 [Dreissena polymorpha]|uniref:Uncharacterized protein n=1 Tax=Dreissena polymorpha TaxID=45954 RepID=A0A9D4H5N7_DREPO|nr:hypothetical protein DPMN_103192 [Dreissena polymorpha]